MQRKWIWYEKKNYLTKKGFQTYKLCYELLNEHFAPNAVDALTHYVLGSI